MRGSEVKVRLSAELHHWVVDEALRGRRSQNAVVVEAVELLRGNRSERLADVRHAAAIELAISIARLPKGTAVMLKSDCCNRSTEVLACGASETNHVLLARVQGEEVDFADDLNTTAIKIGA